MTLTRDQIRRYWDLPDEVLAALPLVSSHDRPQYAPQEYECGCVTFARVTDRDARRGEAPFEMRLALACDTDACEVPRPRTITTKKGSYQMDPLDEAEISTKDAEDIVANLTEEDLRKRSVALDQAQEMFEELACLANPKIPCPECGGSGSVSGGSFGDTCVRCFGARVLDEPGSAPFEMPPFAALRNSITEYGNALADQALPPGHHNRRFLALPPAGSVVTMDAIDGLKADALTKREALKAGFVDPKLLGDKPKPNPLGSDADLGDFDEAELAEMENASESGPSKARPPSGRKRR